MKFEIKEGTKVILKPGYEMGIGDAKFEQGHVYSVVPEAHSDCVNLYELPLNKYMASFERERLYKYFDQYAFEDDASIFQSEISEFEITDGMYLCLSPRFHANAIDPDAKYRLSVYNGNYYEVFSEADGTSHLISKKALFKYFRPLKIPSEGFSLEDGMCVILKEGCPDMGLLFDGDTPYTLKKSATNQDMVEIKSRHDESSAVISLNYLYQWFVPYKYDVKEDTAITNKDERVEHPSHYTWLKKLCGIEVIDITRHMNFNLGNVVKYVLRSGHKHEAGISDIDKRIEDLRKAAFYINDEIRRLQNGVD